MTTLIFTLAACSYDGEYKGGGAALPGQPGCSITAQEIVDPDTPSAGPSANEVLATVSGVERTTTFVPDDGLENQEPWDEALRFGFELRNTSAAEDYYFGWDLAEGEVIAVSYVPEEGERGATCTAGDFLIAPVSVEVDGDHLDGSGDGFLWWHGESLATDLRLWFTVPWTLSVDPTIEALAEDAAEGCSGPPTDYALATTGSAAGDDPPWGSFSLDLEALTAESCGAPLAVSDGVWEEVAAP
jgi:hypothetical protein